MGKIFWGNVKQGNRIHSNIGKKTMTLSEGLGFSPDLGFN
jgi:hypothetical protein